ncbi:hypothetical protein GOP47_0021484 [Adiantum capillus-veneris]|uniref:Uncharacterized protein n=1 Tax=Adiantum capillus-veneris TaxID=13818 RepID=A0A9D4U8G0_ADICA|nr:hypothetical protein GOP47_0021484 [Adiantum capillus-veneris]
MEFHLHRIEPAVVESLQQFHATAGEHKHQGPPDRIIVPPLSYISTLVPRRAARESAIYRWSRGKYPHGQCTLLQSTGNRRQHSGPFSS